MSTRNGWVYEQVCLAEMFKFSTNVIGKLAYIPCYVPILFTNLIYKYEEISNNLCRPSLGI